jgi:Zn-dependent metalloprotease
MKHLVFLFGMISFLSQSKAAQLVDLGQSFKRSALTKITNIDSDLRSYLNMSDSEQFKQRSQIVDKDINHVRYYQTFQGIQVWPQELAVSVKSGRLHRLNGILVKNLDQDIKSIEPKLNSTQALNRSISLFSKNRRAAWKIENKHSDLRIYVDPKTSKGKLVYIVSFFADTNEGGEPSRPLHVIDAHTGKLIKEIENLQHAQATGPGGNAKTGKYYYGAKFPAFEVSEATSGECVMKTDSIKTVNLNSLTSGSTAFSFSCYENVEDVINGSYGALNDAHYFAGVISDLYKNWYNTAPLKIPITMKVHYGKKYENAFWNGSAMHFGDGDKMFYPLVSLDVSSHEIAHGFTEFNSDLVYEGESGGMNEAFSDMAGEATEYYSQGKNDFQIGADIFKTKGKALRYMANPPQDGKSIDHVKKFVAGKKGTDVHHSSGIYNKAFYLLATTKGWNTRKAFDVFVKANQNYWTATSTFASGAQGVVDAAEDLGYPVADVVAAFAPVGINL